MDEMRVPTLLVLCVLDKLGVWPSCVVWCMCSLIGEGGDRTGPTVQDSTDDWRQAEVIRAMLSARAHMVSTATLFALFSDWLLTVQPHFNSSFMLSSAKMLRFTLGHVFSVWDSCCMISSCNVYELEEIVKSLYCMLSFCPVHLKAIHWSTRWGCECCQVDGFTRETGC